MGEAKRRGTREERVKQALERKAAERSLAARYRDVMAWARRRKVEVK